MSAFEESLRDGIAVLREANATLVSYPEIGTERKDMAAHNLATLIRANHEYIPLTGFAITAVYDNVRSSSSYVRLTGDTLQTDGLPDLACEDEESVEGRWLQPDSYYIGGDRTSGGPYGYTTYLGALPHGVYQAKRFEVILDTLRLTTPEEVAPAFAEREKNLGNLDAAWARHMEAQNILFAGPSV